MKKIHIFVALALVLVSAVFIFRDEIKAATYTVDIKADGQDSLTVSPGAIVFITIDANGGTCNGATAGPHTVYSTTTFSISCSKIHVSSCIGTPTLAVACTGGTITCSNYSANNALSCPSGCNRYEVSYNNYVCNPGSPSPSCSIFNNQAGNCGQAGCSPVTQPSCGSYTTSASCGAVSGCSWY